MIDPKQMLMQAAMGRLTQNPIVQKVMQMRQQGLNPQQAALQLSQQYPQFRQLQGMDQQQINSMAERSIRSMGMSPSAIANQLKQIF